MALYKALNKCCWGGGVRCISQKKYDHSFHPLKNKERGKRRTGISNVETIVCFFTSTPVWFWHCTGSQERCVIAHKCRPFAADCLGTSSRLIRRSTEHLMSAAISPDCWLNEVSRGLGLSYLTALQQFRESGRFGTRLCGLLLHKTYPVLRLLEIM